MPNPRGEPGAVNFRFHEINTGSAAGARDEFEQMIAQLIDALHPGARQISPNPGDGGIDVFLGRLDDRIVIWQAKYFLPRVSGASQRRQITESFHSALTNARKHGYHVDQWNLCVPSSMDHGSALWWDRWRRGQTERTSVDIGLWDENTLRTLLSRPQAAAVRTIYYGRSGPPLPMVDEDDRDERAGTWPASSRDQPLPPVPPVLASPGAFERRWQGGETVRLAGRDCLVQGDPAQWWDGSGAWVERSGTVAILGAPPRAAWFRQVRIREPGDEAAEALVASVGTQLRLLAELEGGDGIPAPIGSAATPVEATLLTVRPPGRTWREVFGPADTPQARPLDQVTAIELLRIAAGLGDLVTMLHEHGHSHRALDPDGVILRPAGPPARIGRTALRDIGLAGVARRPGEAPAQYRPPEQERLGAHGPRVGLRTDVFRLAAMTYHCVTGCPPTRGMPARLGDVGFDVPDVLDEVLLAALDPDPGGRPDTMGVLVDALRAGADRLARMAR